MTRDLNGDGVINNGKELFGNNTMLKNGELAKNGFEALKDLDENNDGVFDAQDPLFNEVLLWIDEGSDGISHPEELFTLSEKSILSIDLVYENVNILDPRGHSI